MILYLAGVNFTHLLLFLTNSLSLKTLANDCRLVTILDNLLALSELTSTVVSLENIRSCN